MRRSQLIVISLAALILGSLACMSGGGGELESEPDADSSAEPSGGSLADLPRFYRSIR